MSENISFYNIYNNYTNYTYIVSRITKDECLPNGYYSHIKYIRGQNVFKMYYLDFKIVVPFEMGSKNIICGTIYYIILISAVIFIV